MHDETTDLMNTLTFTLGVIASSEAARMSATLPAPTGSAGQASTGRWAA